MMRGKLGPVLGVLGAATILMGCQGSSVRASAEDMVSWDGVPIQEGGETTSLSLAIYNDWGLVSDARAIRLIPGNQVVRFTGVAAYAESRGGYLQVPAQVTQARFRYDLLNRERLIERYNGQTVEIWPKGATASLLATLLVTDSGPVYRINDRLYTDPPGRVAFPPMPGVALQPTLEWMVMAQRAFQGVATASYVANRIGWQSAYTLRTDANMTRGDLSHWAALSNQSGGDYKNAQMTLVAGDIRRDGGPPVPMARNLRAYAESVSPESFGARYVYRIGSMTLLRGTDERVRLGASALTLTRTYRIESWAGPRLESDIPTKARIRLSFTPDTPLPRGKVTVYAPEPGGGMAIAGEPSIPDSPKNQSVILDLGEAFDVTAERRQTTYRITADATVVGYSITLRNQQSVPVSVELLENLSGDWTLLSNSHPYTRLSASQLRFNPEVPARGEVTVTYEASIKRAPLGVS